MKSEPFAGLLLALLIVCAVGILVISVSGL
jgi:hypothetical protein